MLAIQEIHPQAENARIALIIAAVAIMAYWRRLLFIMFRVLIIVLIVAAVVGAVVIAKIMQG